MEFPHDKKSMALYLLFLISFGYGGVFISAQLQKFQHPAKHDGSLSFLVLGDWGRRGAFNQSQVASQVHNHFFLLFKENIKLHFHIKNTLSFFLCLILFSFYKWYFPLLFVLCFQLLLNLTNAFLYFLLFF